jgi:NAD(P)H-dependent FMN reductase
VPTLLIVHCTVSPSLHTMFEAVHDGATNADLRDAGIDVAAGPAQAAPPPHVHAADPDVLGTPANLGYMSGALKHFFDQIYYPCLDATAGRPFGLYVHGGSDTTGAVRAVDTITTGLKWRRVADHVVVTGGPPDRAAVDACWNLGASVAASLLPE